MRMQARALKHICRRTPGDDADGGAQHSPAIQQGVVPEQLANLIGKEEAGVPSRAEMQRLSGKHHRAQMARSTILAQLSC
eukprot:1063871-Pleurochrysis_carterae.AAC.2